MARSVMVEWSADPIRLTARGEWLHGRDRILPRVVALFERHIQVDALGRYWIVLGPQAAPVEVEDAAFFVRTMTLEPEEGPLSRVLLGLSDGRELPLAPATLMQSEDNVLYCRVPCAMRGGGEQLVPCRFPPGLYHALALRAELEDGRGVLEVGGRRFVFGEYVRSTKRLAQLT